MFFSERHQNKTCSINPLGAQPALFCCVACLNMGGLLGHGGGMHSTDSFSPKVNRVLVQPVNPLRASLVQHRHESLCSHIIQSLLWALLAVETQRTGSRVDTSSKPPRSKRSLSAFPLQKQLLISNSTFIFSFQWMKDKSKVESYLNGSK